MVDVEAAPWLKGIPVAPEYHPSEAEFADPITFILRIEEEVRQFGICKVVPPVAKQSRKSAVCNLEKCVAAAQGKSAAHPDENSLARIKFATERQRVGCANDADTLQGGTYSLEQFEARSKEFARGKLGTTKDVPSLALETLFWQSIERDKCTFVEHASSIPGSAFPENEFEPPDAKKRKKNSKEKEPSKLANSSWNMRYLSQLQGSLFRFMPNTVPGVTAPSLSISMLCTWSAWQTDEHELHTVNYLHFGFPKTWYAVPPGAGAAFEDVSFVHGVDSEEGSANMSPEVFVSNGVPCCRLVQNPGEFVIVLPRSYNLKFSHGFNVGETCNIATPGWLKVAKEAAVRRAAANRSPVFCHEQLLYQAAQAFSKSTHAIDIRSSRLKHKMKLCTDEVLRVEFVKDFMKNQQVLLKLEKLPEARCILLRENEGEKENLCNLVNLGTIDSISLLSFLCESMEGSGGEDDSPSYGAPRLNWGALSCAVCGSLCYSCIGIIQPTSETATSFLPNKNSRCPRKRSVATALPACFLCAEHALQVSLILQDIGGSRVLTVCHPEYQTFEMSAKQIAKDVNVEFLVKDISFQKGNEEDFQLIRTATGTADWVTQLSVTSQGTVNLNKNKETDDPASDEDNYVEKTLKEKKCWVVGRWCGRVWRYDQAHVLLGGCISPGGAREKRKDDSVLDEERQHLIDELTRLRRNCRKKRRTQLTKVDAEPQSQCMAISPPVDLAIEASDRAPVDTENDRCVKDEDNLIKLPRDVVGEELQDDSMVPACNCKSSIPQELENSRDSQGGLHKQRSDERADSFKQELESQTVQAWQCDSDVKQVFEAPLREEIEYEILTPDNKEPQSSEREWSWHVENSLAPDADAELGCTSNIGSLWHEVPVSFSPTLRSIYMEIGGRAKSQVRLDVRNMEESLEAETEENRSDPGDISSCDREVLKSADETVSQQNQDDAASSRSKRVKRKSWRATASDENQERPAKSLKRRTAAGSSKKAGSPTKNTKSQGAINVDVESAEAEIVHSCDFDGCTMSFATASDLALHKRNICTIKECGKRLCNHNYLMQHHRVHVDDRPLKCEWKGCKKTFKWSWARTEHMRVHTGARPYVCNQCGKNYRFVSDFSRHKRTTGHMTQ